MIGIEVLKHNAMNVLQYRLQVRKELIRTQKDGNMIAENENSKNI